MKQFLIFAVILLATLSMVNAAPLHKRETKFGKCPRQPKAQKQPDLIKSVTINPDPVAAGKDVTFHISTTLTSDITSEDELAIGFFDLFGVLLQEQSNFSISGHIPAGDEFKVKISLTTPAEATVPPGYVIAVAIGSKNLDTDLKGCALAVVGGSSSESYPIASYPIAGRSYPIAEEDPDSYPIAERSA